MYASMMVEVGDEVASTVDLEEDEDITESVGDEEEEEEMEGYAFPIGPLPQQVTNDLKSLDEMVSHSFCPWSQQWEGFARD